MEEKIENEVELEKEEKRYFKKVAKKLLSVVLVFIALIIGFKFAIFFLPFVIALVITKIMSPLVKFMKEKLKIKHNISVIISVVLVVAILGTLLTFLVTKLINEVYSFASNIAYYTTAIENTSTWVMNEMTELFKDLPEAVTLKVYSSLGKIVDTVLGKAGEAANSVLNGVIALPKILIYTIITILATLFIGLDKIYIMEACSDQLPDRWGRKIYKVGKDAFSGIAAYVKSQATIILMTFVELLVGFNVLNLIGFKIEYVLTLAITIAIIDAFPILGCGTVLIPWAVYSAFTGNISMAIAIFILYLIITIVRQLVEPKIISKNIGVHPIFTLIAMYTGFRLFGFLGFIFGPIIMFMLKNIFSKQLEKGFFKDIFEK